MDSVELTIKYMMLKYPYVYTSKMVACDHLFMCTGNGYEWKDGMIQPAGGLPANLDFTELAILAKLKIERKPYPEHVKKQCLFIVDNADLLVKEKYPFHPYRSFHGISKESLCMITPDNIAEDWHKVLVWFMRYYKLFLNEMQKGLIKLNKESYEKQKMLTETVIKHLTKGI